MGKASEFLKAAELALAHGLTNACAQECYYAMFWQPSLCWNGQVNGEPSGHTAMSNAIWDWCSFGNGIYAPRNGADGWKTAYNLRLKAAYGREPVSKSEAQTVPRYAPNSFAKHRGATMRKTKKGLQRFVNELCEYARQLFPGARVYVKPPYETEDADIVVELPEGWKRGIARQERALMQRKWDILLDTGYDIVVFVKRPNRRKAKGAKKKATETSATR